MIKSKEDLRLYLDECRKAYDKPVSRGLKGLVADLILPDRNYIFMRNLCKYEYWANRRGGGNMSVYAGLPLISSLFVAG